MRCGREINTTNREKNITISLLSMSSKKNKRRSGNMKNKDIDLVNY